MSICTSFQIAPALEPVDYLLLAMSAGKLPVDLSQDEVELLEKEEGKFWFKKLGYTDALYARPTF